MSTVWGVVLAVAAVALWPGPVAPRGPGAGAGASPVRSVGRVRVALTGWFGSRRVGSRVRPDDEWVADLAEVVAVGLDAGLDLPRAVLTACHAPTVAERAPWLYARVAAAVGDGRGVASGLAGPLDPSPDGLSRASERGAGDGVDVLGRAWRLSEEVGAAASTTTAAAAAVLRSRAADRRRAATLVAGPRASMWLLTALPLLGPVLGLLAGVGPGRLYGSPLARTSALVGVLFAAVGWLWARRLLRRAQRPGTVSGRRG